MRRLLLFLAFFATSAFAADRVIINPDQDGDLKLKVNDGGVVKEPVSITGSTTTMTVGASGHTDALLRVGNGNTRNESFSVDVSKSGYTGFIRNLGSAVGSSVLFLESNASTNATNMLQITSAGGTSLTATADGKTELNVRTDASCGIGNICSGTYSASANSGSNVTVSLVANTQFLKVGEMVIISGRINSDPTALNWSYRLTLPSGIGTVQASSCQGTAVAGDPQVCRVSGPISGDIVFDCVDTNAAANPGPSDTRFTVMCQFL
jgi:hypothetical protein